MFDWKILDSGKERGSVHMEMDRKLLKELPSFTKPLLHFYDWSEIGISYGHFMKPDHYLNLQKIPSTKRPTGGGIVFHCNDFSFSLFIPKDHLDSLQSLKGSYALINSLVARVIQKFLRKKEEIVLFEEEKKENFPFCMIQPVMYDVLLNGKKVAGGAQRRTKAGLLHQGTIQLAFVPEEILREVLKDPSFFLPLFSKHQGSLLSGFCSPSDIEQAKKEIKKFLLKELLTQSTNVLFLPK